jgi:hypothetical protein
MSKNSVHDIKCHAFESTPPKLRLAAHSRLSFTSDLPSPELPVKNKQMRTEISFAPLPGIATEMLAILAVDTQTAKGSEAKPQPVLLTTDRAVQPSGC